MDHADVLVIGHGMVGHRLVEALVERDRDRPVEHLMNTQLDRTGGGLLRSAIESSGITVIAGRAEVVLSGAGSGRAEALRLDDGRVLPADVVILATGVRPRVDVATASGIETGHGIVVDDRLATSADGVYAVGECVEHRATTCWRSSNGAGGPTASWSSAGAGWTEPCSSATPRPPRS